MAIFSKTVHWIRMKIANFVHLGIMHFFSKNHENPTYQLKDILISISALLYMSMNKNVLQLNFLNQYFTKYKLGWDKVFQKSNYYYNVSPHQKLDKPTSRILRKMWIGCKWWWSFYWKPCTGLSWNLPRLFFMMLCILCPNFMKI